MKNIQDHVTEKQIAKVSMKGFASGDSFHSRVNGVNGVCHRR